MAKTLLGRSVLYTDGQGFQKSARVIGTYDSIQPGTNVKRPAEGNVNLLVESPTGDQSKNYSRFDVAPGTGKRQFQLR